MTVNGRHENVLLCAVSVPTLPGGELSGVFSVLHSLKGSAAGRLLMVRIGLNVEPIPTSHHFPFTVLHCFNSLQFCTTSQHFTVPDADSVFDDGVARSWWSIFGFACLITANPVSSLTFCSLSAGSGWLIRADNRVEWRLLWCMHNHTWSAS